MKIIFSRKGMDSSFHNLPSPILPDGKLCWLPIPENIGTKHDLPTYEKINFHNMSMGKMISDLSNGKLSPNQTVHLDPDLYSGWRPRPIEWHPAFGQTGAAESHLIKMKVSTDDLFIFFGWFKQTEMKNGKLQYVKKSPDLHVIYGWLQIKERISRGLMFDPPEWLNAHAHAHGEPYDRIDSIYIPNNNIVGFDRLSHVNGAGYFDDIKPSLVLTAPNKTRSYWKLPLDFYPNTREPLSYHSDMSRWSVNNESVILRTVGRGQEFILNLDYYDGVRSWIIDEIFGCTYTP